MSSEAKKQVGPTPWCPLCHNNIYFWGCSEGKCGKPVPSPAAGGEKAAVLTCHNQKCSCYNLDFHCAVEDDRCGICGMILKALPAPAPAGKASLLSRALEHLKLEVRQCQCKEAPDGHFCLSCNRRLDLINDLLSPHPSSAGHRNKIEAHDSNGNVVERFEYDDFHLALAKADEWRGRGLTVKAVSLPTKESYTTCDQCQRPMRCLCGKCGGAEKGEMVPLKLEIGQKVLVEATVRWFGFTTGYDYPVASVSVGEHNDIQIPQTIILPAPDGGKEVRHEV